MKFSSGQVNYFWTYSATVGSEIWYRKTRGVYYHVVAVAQKEIQGNCEKTYRKGRLYDSREMRVCRIYDRFLTSSFR